MSTLCYVKTAMLWGVEAKLVQLEVNISAGLAGISVVGRVDVSVAEGRTRVRCALGAAGFKVPRKSVTINLAPADMKKTGSSFDLPMAVAILVATGQIPADELETSLIVGELSLVGEVLPIRGLIAYAELAKREGLRLICPPGELYGFARELDIGFACHLSEFHDGLKGIASSCPQDSSHGVSEQVLPDFCEVAGQELAKRALTLAACAGLGILMIGPPGIGKTMLARCLCGILPPLNDEEYTQTALMYSVCGVEGTPARQRPFRAPHHSTSTAGLLGGGRPPHPGEISLAHNGVLFLDELGEFNRAALQALRQPMEEGLCRVTRVEGTYIFPSRFQLVAASNPCPCGYFGDPSGKCTCSDASIRTYQAKLAGPLIDRIDMAVTLARPEAKELLGSYECTSSDQMRQTVEKTRQFCSWRVQKFPPAPDTNKSKRGKLAQLIQEHQVSPAAFGLLERLSDVKGVSARGLTSLLRVARVIADTEEQIEVSPDHVLEAFGFRFGAEEQR